MSLPELTHTGRRAATLPTPSPCFAAPDAGGQATRLAAPHRPGRPTPHAAIGARPTAVEQVRNPRVIDGEVTGSWFPRPMLPMLAGSAAMFALGLAALVQEAIR